MRNLFLFSDAHFLWLGIEMLLSPIFFCFSLIPTYIVNRQANSDISILCLVNYGASFKIWTKRTVFLTAYKALLLHCLWINSNSRFLSSVAKWEFFVTVVFGKKPKKIHEFLFFSFSDSGQCSKIREHQPRLRQ